MSKRIHSMKDAFSPRGTRVLFLLSIVVCFLFILFIKTTAFSAHRIYGQNALPAVSLLLSGGGSCHFSADDSSDPKYNHSDEGLYDFAPVLPTQNYTLPQLSDREFNNLSFEEKLSVADKLLSTLFYGYDQETLEEMISSGHFLCSVKKGLTERKNSISKVETYIRNEDYFYRNDSDEDADTEIYDILARFYAMEHLDEYYFHNWIAYILTQTILFSPAEELESAHKPDIANVYNWLVFDMEDDISMRYSTYMHMTGVENWRRFRSPEDNGREMMEIYLLDFQDSHVPIAATALQNWYLDNESDSLVIGMNKNTRPLSLFRTTIFDGFDFYRELVKSDAFTEGITSRLVDFFFGSSATEQKAAIVDKIVRSNPERWEDILMQLVFSREYLLHSDRQKSLEELFFSLVKKMPYKHFYKTFYRLTNTLDNANQASMRYKLGRIERTPLDTLSFAFYYQFVYEYLAYTSADCDELDNYTSYYSEGWLPAFTDERHFSLIEDTPEQSMISFINYLFLNLIQRYPYQQEMDMFLDAMLEENHTQYIYKYNLERQNDAGCYEGREYAAARVIDYCTRLTEFYWLEKVQR